MSQTWDLNTWKSRLATQANKMVENGDRLLNQLSESQRRHRFQGEVPAQIDARDVFKQQLPVLTQQLMGSRVSGMMAFLSELIPFQTLDVWIEDIFNQAVTIAEQSSGLPRVMAWAGVNDIIELRLGDVARCEALVPLVLEENRMIAMAEGGLTGATGAVGALVDLPLIFLLAIRTVCQVAHCYGFDLKHPQDRELIYTTLKNSDLELLADKQGVMLVLNGVRAILESGDQRGMEQLANGGEEIQAAGTVFNEFVRSLNLRVPTHWLSRAMPVVTGLAGATYNAKVIGNVIEHAQAVFQEAREQGIEQARVQVVANSLAADRIENHEDREES